MTTVALQSDITLTLPNNQGNLVFPTADYRLGYEFQAFRPHAKFLAVQFYMVHSATNSAVYKVGDPVPVTEFGETVELNRAAYDAYVVLLNRLEQLTMNIDRWQDEIDSLDPVNDAAAIAALEDQIDDAETERDDVQDDLDAMGTVTLQTEDINVFDDVTALFGSDGDATNNAVDWFRTITTGGIDIDDLI
jgi:hypothetical protein